jgi:hypothetical protein
MASFQLCGLYNNVCDDGKLRIVTDVRKGLYEIWGSVGGASGDLILCERYAVYE